MEDVAPEDPDAWMRWRFNDPLASAGAEGSRTYQRYEFARWTAHRIIDCVDYRTMLPFRPSHQVSLRTVMFTADQGYTGHDQFGYPLLAVPDGELMVVVGSHEPPSEVEKALPYALEVAGERDLVFFVPEGSQWPILARLPWIDHHARLYTYSPATPSMPYSHLQLDEHAVPLRVQVLESTKHDTEVGVYKLSPTHLGWVDELVAWADNHPRLITSHRAAYLGWQVDGRLVLRISRASGGKLRVAAGVRPGTASPSATGFEALLDGPLVDPEPLREAVRQAIQNRIAGNDSANLEHRLQARLQMLLPEPRMGLVTLVPEFPALRPRPGGPGGGFVDFLGVDAEGRLHVVETKVGASESTVLLQALDYWDWAEANRVELAAALGADAELRVGLSVVVAPGPDGRLLHRHNRFVLDRLSRSVPLTVWRAANDLKGDLQITQVPTASLRKNSRFSDRLRKRVTAAALLDGPITRDRRSIEGLHQEAVKAAEGLKDQGKLHGYVGLPHSSQRFALDLFGPLGEDGVEKILTRFFGRMTGAWKPTFEWTDTDHLLKESTIGRPYQTQIDVKLDGETIDGRIVALLVEVKLTEEEFGGCSHAEIAPPELRSNCATSGPFGAEPSLCWQLRNRDEGWPRRYDQVLSFNAKPPRVEAGCWFLKRNQPMRIAATAQAIRETDEYDECLTVLTIPQGHAAMRRRWQESIDMMGESVLGWLDPEVVITALSPSAAANAIDRYGLDVPDARSRDPVSPLTRSWDLAVELKLLLWDSVKLIETHPGGGMYDCLSLYDAEMNTIFDINRQGSLHYTPFGDEPDALRTVWHDLAAGRFDDVLAWCLTKPALQGRTHNPRREWIRIMPRLAYTYEGRATWKNGVFDTSGYPGDPYRRELLFGGMSFLELDPMEGMDQLGGAYAYWFLESTDGKPLAAINIDAEKGWLPNGDEFQLRDQYDAFMARLGL